MDCFSHQNIISVSFFLSLEGNQSSRQSGPTARPGASNSRAMATVRDTGTCLPRSTRARAVYSVSYTAFSEAGNGAPLPVTALRTSGQSSVKRDPPVTLLRTENKNNGRCRPPIRAARDNGYKQCRSLTCSCDGASGKRTTELRHPCCDRRCGHIRRQESNPHRARKLEKRRPCVPRSPFV